MINWGIIGAGNIANRFAASLENFQDAQLYGVACRTMEKAQAFQAKFPCDIVFDDYQNLLDDPTIDVVYIALPHLYHYEWIIKAFQAKKAVLCEKPATLTAQEMRDVQKQAQAHEVFFMEAMKPRFTPAYRKLKELVDGGHIGELTSVMTTFRRHLPVEGSSYHYLPKQGGALLDMGIYNLAFIQDFSPENLTAELIDYSLYETGVDTYVEARFVSEDFVAVIETGFDQTKETVAELQGTKGKITIPNFHRPASFTVTIDQEDTVYDIGYEIDDFHSEIQAVHTALAQGQLENPLMSLTDSIACIALADELRSLLDAEKKDN
ncbi:Gfo/Idh/MocA family protein [Enterococcus casseliflavus]|uniref:Gfo/Idh/MocA family protein n=1 Tax=Enterococcus casseliflavus TaxID=37734 RepID=UPI0039A5428D